MELNLKGKKALVTGSSSGIGEGIAKMLAKEGVYVAVHGRNEKEIQRVVNEIKKSGGKAEAIKGDLTNDKEANTVGKQAQKLLSSIDILINNAGAFPKRSWNEGEVGDWIDLFNTNVFSMVRMIKFVLPHMKKKSWGRIIQIGSVAGIFPTQDLPDYGATKAASINMSISLAKELSASGITVNTVSPGPILTEGVRVLFEQFAKQNKWEKDWKSIEKRVIKEVLPNIVGRFGTPEEVGALVAFLCSPVADFITGANYVIDGGRLG